MRLTRIVGRLGVAVLAMMPALAIVPAPAHATTNYYQFLFTRNRMGDTNGRLYLLYGGLSVVDTWRAGSGMGGYDECTRNKGPIPVNGYKIIGYSYNKPGSSTGVRGAELQLADTHCYNGTPRTELFVHSTYPWSSSHYHSLGCIKVSNTGGPNNSGGSGDIKKVVSEYLRVGRPAMLYVHNS